MRTLAAEFAAAGLLALSPAVAYAQQSFAVTVETIDQNPNVLQVSGKLGKTEFAADCGIIPKSDGKALRHPAYDSLSLLSDTGFSRTTEIEGNIVLLSPDPKDPKNRSLISVFSQNGNVVTKSYPVRADEAPYTYKGPSEYAPPTPVSFNEAKRMIAGANAICEHVVKDLSAKKKVDTSPKAVADNRAQTPEFQQKRAAYIEALHWH